MIKLLQSELSATVLQKSVPSVFFFLSLLLLELIFNRDSDSDESSLSLESSLSRGKVVVFRVIIFWPWIIFSWILLYLKNKISLIKILFQVLKNKMLVLLQSSWWNCISCPSLTQKQKLDRLDLPVSSHIDFNLM